MSSGIATVYDDYKAYVELCEKMKVQPIGNGSMALAAAGAGFYGHWETLQRQYMQQETTRGSGG